MKYARIILLLVVGFAGGYVASTLAGKASQHRRVAFHEDGQQSLDPETQILALSLGEPDEDVEQALRKGDKRYIAIQRHSVVPGVEGNPGDTKFIIAPSDYVASFAQEQLVTLTRNYASEYNKCLQAKLAAK
jgi:hypothetical protein